MTKTEVQNLSARPYTAPRLIRPDSDSLAPEAKYFVSRLENWTSFASSGPS